ncbi:MAG: hypothetical protein IJY05_03040 [Clostridia bacterium]|nr:hypothetical protein [Clostridia bacterium]
MKKQAISIPNFMYDEAPILAGVCEIINVALEQNPDMSLAEFARVISEANQEKACERLEKAIERQFKGESESV